MTLVKRRKSWRISCDVAEVTERLENEQSYVTSYVTTNSPTLPSLYLRHSSFSKPSVASPTSQFILQPFFRFSYFTSSSLNSPGEQSSFSNLSVTHLRYNSFSNSCVASPTSQLFLQPFFCFSYFTSSSLNSPGEQSSFSNLSLTSPTLQLILQPFRCFTYVTAHSPTLLSLLLLHKLFT